MDNRSILAIVFCVLFYLAYSQYLSKKYPKHPHPASQTAGQMHKGNEATQPTAATTSPTAAVAPGTPAGTPVTAEPQVAPIAQLTAAQLTIETDDVIYHFDQEIGGLKDAILKHYKTDDQKSQVNLLTTGPMAIQATTTPSVLTPVKGVFHAERQGRTLRFWRQDGNFKVSHEFTVPATGYDLSLKASFTNTSANPLDLTAGVLVQETLAQIESKKLLGIIPNRVIGQSEVIYNVDDSTEWLDIKKLCTGDKEPPHLKSQPVRYLGVDRHYFLGVILPKAKLSNMDIGHGASLGEHKGCPVSLTSYDKQGRIKPGDTVTLDFSGFFGPKDNNILAAVDPNLPSSIQLGYFGVIGRPLLVVIDAFYKLTHNYGVAIILLTIALKALFYPLVRSSSVSMHKMKKLNPEMAAIRERLKDDKQKQQQEIMKFMMANKINPMKGCLPVLPQIPVFFAFDEVLATSIKLRHAPFLFWIHDLSSMDPFFILPILMGIGMFFQQRLTPTTGMDKTQEKIMMFMPIIFTAMMVTLPAGLTLYMLTNTIIGIAQQRWLYRKLDKLEA